MLIREQVKKKVVKSGNGGAVWVPKNWLGEEVVVILPEKPRLDVRERVIHQLEPYFKDIVSVSLFGSYSRGEQTPESDVDVLVVTLRKMRLQIKGLDIISVTREQLEKAIVKYPTLYYQVIQEAQPLVNSSIVEELRHIQVTEAHFQNYLLETKEHLQSSKELLELDKLDGKLCSYSIIYSSVLRLKGIYIIHCFMGKRAFTSNGFRKWLLNNGLNNNEFKMIYTIYRVVRKDHTPKTTLSLATAEKLITLLQRELEVLLCPTEKRGLRKASNH